MIVWAHQLLSAISTNRASDSVTYVYDKAGNPTRRKELGLTTAYTFNNLNQFASGSWTGGLTVVGEVNYAAGTVTVNSVSAKIFPDRVFEATNITVSAGTNVLTAIYHGPAFTNTQMVATNTSTVVMATPDFGYDAKGNLTNDAEFVYQYDIANRLTNVVSKESGSSALAARYDGLGRRIEVTRSGTTVERYVYFPGSFLVLAILDGSNTVKEIYTHGPDLSGTVGGAGGIGGILSVTTNITDSAARNYFHADAMGNVVLASSADGKQVAAYGYTPFGKLVNKVGDFQARFLYNSKELDADTGLVFYGLRFLNTDSGTWTTRDPAGEHASINLYSFIENAPFHRIDFLGDRSWTYRTAVNEVRSTYRSWASSYPFASKLMKHWLEENISALETSSAIPDYMPDSSDIQEVKRHGTPKLRRVMTSYLRSVGTPTAHTSSRIDMDWTPYIDDGRMWRAYGGARLEFSSSRIRYYYGRGRTLVDISGRFRMHLDDVYAWPSRVFAFFNATYDAAKWLQDNCQFKNFAHEMDFQYEFTK